MKIKPPISVINLPNEPMSSLKMLTGTGSMSVLIL